MGVKAAPFSTSKMPKGVKSGPTSRRGQHQRSGASLGEPGFSRRVRSGKSELRILVSTGNEEISWWVAFDASQRKPLGSSQNVRTVGGCGGPSAALRRAIYPRAMRAVLGVRLVRRRGHPQGRRPSTLAMTDWLKNPINLLGIFALLTPTAQGTCPCSSSDSAEVQLSGACWRQVRPAARMNTSWGIRAFRAPVEL